MFTSLFESIRIALLSLRSNLLRASLSSVSIAVGIFLVTMMGWALRSIDNVWNDMINTLGNDMLYVDKWDWAGGRNWAEIRARKNISLTQAKEFASRMDGAEAVIPMGSWWGRSVVYKDLKVDGITVTGTRADYTKTAAGTVAEGRFFSDAEDHHAANVAIIGYGVKRVLFPNEECIGKIIKIGGKPFEIIGHIDKRGTAFMDFVDNQMFIPLNSFIAIYGSTARSISIAVKAGSPELLDETRERVIGEMRIIRNLKPEEENDFSINETQAFRTQVADIRFKIYAVGIGLTGLSFFVGMIGIMNVMFVTVTERTKEIGIRKSLGARRTSILTQFLVESATLCFAGALIGIAFCSIAVTLIVAIVKSSESSWGKVLSAFVPPDVLSVAIIVAVIVGVIAGIIPAIRAAALNPVDALRYES